MAKTYKVTIKILSPGGYLLWPLSYIHIYNCVILNFSKAVWPIFNRFHMGPFFEGILKICSNGSTPLTKIATMPIYGKKYLKIFSRTKKALRLKLGIFKLYMEPSVKGTAENLYKWAQSIYQDDSHAHIRQCSR